MVGPELASKGGLKIYTTLDPDLQTAAEESVQKQVAKLAKQGAHNGAVVAVRPQTGEVLAMVGSADFNSVEISGQINMAIQPRQPGSALKPFVYLSAFEMPASVATDANSVGAALQARINALSVTPAPDADTNTAEPPSAIEPPGYWTPATTLMDITTQFPDPAGPYVPANYDGKEHGLVTVRSALANSLNIPAVKALQHAGLDRLKDVAQRAGITTLTRPDYGLSLALGGGDVTLVELTGAYATLANGGTRVPVSPIACVLDAEGRLIWRGAAAQSVQGCLGASGDPAAGVAVTPQPSVAGVQLPARISDHIDPVGRRGPAAHVRQRTERDDAGRPARSQSRRAPRTITATRGPWASRPISRSACGWATRTTRRCSVLPARWARRRSGTT